MDTLLSLPFLSLLFLPTYFSTGTSLNLLFFYLTWSTLILSHSLLKVEFILTLAVRVVFFLLPAVVFLAFDTLVPSIATHVKYQGHAGLPLRNRRGESRRLAWVVLLSFVNVVLGVGAQCAMEYLFIDVLKIRSALKVTTTLPLPWAIGKDLVKGFATREVCLTLRSPTFANSWLGPQLQLSPCSAYVPESTRLPPPKLVPQHLLAIFSCCSLRSPVTLSPTRLPTDIPSSTRIPLSPSDLSPLPHPDLLGRALRLQRLQCSPVRSGPRRHGSPM